MNKKETINLQKYIEILKIDILMLEQALEIEEEFTKHVEDDFAD